MNRPPDQTGAVMLENLRDYCAARIEGRHAPYEADCLPLQRRVAQALDRATGLEARAIRRAAGILQADLALMDADALYRAAAPWWLRLLARVS
jgi:hypothetical protein